MIDEIVLISNSSLPQPEQLWEDCPYQAIEYKKSPHFVGGKFKRLLICKMQEEETRPEYECSKYTYKTYNYKITNN